MFDPYYAWLGIPADEQPPTHYRLLGIREFEENDDVISNAADRQMGFVRQFASGPHKADAHELLNNLAAAKFCLLSYFDKSLYDDAIRASRGGAIQVIASPNVVLVGQPVVQEPQPLRQPHHEPVAEASFATDTTAAAPRKVSRKSTPSRGPSYSQGVAFVFAVGAALIGVVYAWNVLGRQKLEIEKAQAMIDRAERSANKPAEHRPAKKKIEVAVTSQPSHAPQRRPSIRQGKFAASNSQLADLASQPIAEPTQPEPVESIAPRLSESTPSAPATRESFASRAWSIQLPANRLMSRQDVLIPGFAEGAITAPTPTFPWKSANLTGFFKFTQASGNNSLYQINGVGVTIYDETRPRTFGKYLKGYREGEFWMLDEKGGPLLFAHFIDNEPYGLLCYCTSGVPAIIQRRSGDTVDEKYLISISGSQLVAAVPSTETEAEYTTLANGLESLLAKLDKEHSDCNIAFRRWVREEQESKRRELAAKLAPIKRQNASARAQQREAQEAENLRRIMRASRGY